MNKRPSSSRKRKTLKDSSLIVGKSVVDSVASLWTVLPPLEIAKSLLGAYAGNGQRQILKYRITSLGATFLNLAFKC